MEEIKKKESYPLALGVQRNSQTISKIKPKIRIIHIYAPEVIKTDAANFRDLVQRLTGKPTEIKKNSRKIDHSVSSAPEKMEVIRGGLHHFPEKMIKNEDEIWSDANSGGGFLGGFAELEGFMDQLNHEFPLIPVTAAQLLDPYGEPQLAYN